MEAVRNCDITAVSGLCFFLILFAFFFVIFPGKQRAEKGKYENAWKKRRTYLPSRMQIYSLGRK